MCGPAFALIMRVLVTRPQEDAQRTAAALAARGHHVRTAPLLTIETISGADLGLASWQAVLMTSANAARAIAVHPRRAELRALPVLAVGRRTAEAARAAGFADVTSADGTAGDLARLVAERLGAGAKLLYLAGSDRARDPAADLAPLGIAVRTIEVYRARAAGAFAPEIAAALRAGEFDAVLHFSRRSAEIFLRCAEHAGALGAALRARQLCISAQAAEPLAQAGAREIRIAPQPDEDALVGMIGAA